MLKIEKIQTYGFETAVRGMRNPYNSWDKSDSDFYDEDIIGENDHDLMRKLAEAGTDHGKYLRFLTCNMDITGPLYWWKEFDTYRAGVEKNSCSTMHCIASKEFDFGDFSCEHLTEISALVLQNVIDALNIYRDRYLRDKDKNYWRQMIQLLPSSYNQKRTVMCSYAALRNMYHSRKNHRLDEWHEFCNMIEQLPYSEFITGDYDAEIN